MLGIACGRGDGQHDLFVIQEYIHRLHRIHRLRRIHSLHRLRRLRRLSVWWIHVPRIDEVPVLKRLYTEV